MFQDKYYVIVPDKLDYKTLNTRVQMAPCPCAWWWLLESRNAFGV